MGMVNKELCVFHKMNKQAQKRRGFLRLLFAFKNRNVKLAALGVITITIMAVIGGFLLPTLETSNASSFSGFTNPDVTFAPASNSASRGQSSTADVRMFEDAQAVYGLGAEPEAMAQIKVKLAEMLQSLIPAAASNKSGQFTFHRLLSYQINNLFQATQNYDALAAIAFTTPEPAGATGDETEEDSSDISFSSMEEDQAGTGVTILQEQLVDLGYLDSVTGLFGTETVSAFSEFQRRNNLPAGGVLTEQAFNLLFSTDAIPSESKALENRTRANIDIMIEAARAALGKRYILGARGPDTFDCSGLVYYCLNRAGSNRSRLNAAGYSQVQEWPQITDINQLKRGDLIFFYDNAYTKVGHVGIIISDTEMIDASNAQHQVVQRPYNTAYWRSHFVCGRSPW